MKKYWIYIVILVIAGLAIGFYLYNKPHQNIRNSKADFRVEASGFFTEYEENEQEANTKYLDKIVEIEGIVRSVSTDEKGTLSVMLESGNEFSGVNCQLDELTEHKNTTFNPGDKVTFKGICTGMLMDVVMVRCVEVETN